MTAALRCFDCGRTDCPGPPHAGALCPNYTAAPPPVAKTVQAAVVAYAAALAELLCDFDIVDDTSHDGFTPVTVAKHRPCGWLSRPVDQACLGLLIDDAMEHLQEAHSA